jgi:hypothetical protein
MLAVEYNTEIHGKNRIETDAGVCQKLSSI